MPPETATDHVDDRRPADDGPYNCNYPDWTPGETEARIRLLMWVGEQIAAGVIVPQVGDYVLATDGRILGFGPERDELSRRVRAAEPGLRNARVVGMRVPPHEW